MPKAGSCKICAHTDRSAIEAALRSGMSFRTGSNQFGVSKSALIRHRKAHMQQCPPVAPPVERRYDPLLAKKACELEKAISDALLNNRVVDLRWALQDVARLLVAITKEPGP